MKNAKRFFARLSIGKILKYCILLCITLMVWIPIYMVIEGSLIGSGDIKAYIGSILENGNKYVDWPVFPMYPTLRSYVELLLDTPKFFVMFGNSVIQVLPALLGQLLIAVPAAWSFARFRFPLKRFIFAIYIVLMILPFQVTMVSSYLVLYQFNLLDSHLSIILPAIFSTFPVFIMVKFFKSIPEEMIEAAKIDGAGNIRIFLKVGIPLGYSGIMSAVILSFIEVWNSLEQPLTFLKDQSKWPLALYLPQISNDKIGVSFIASIVMMMPALLIFLTGEKYLEQGIVASGIKQ